MAFTGQVHIVKRKNTLHCGNVVRFAGEIKTVSLCNAVWNISDSYYIANAADVTCKRCKKLLERADEKGRVELKGRRKK